MSMLEAAILADLMDEAYLLGPFVRESNKIEGITRDPTKAEIAAHRAFVLSEEIKIADLTKLVKVCQPDAVLRDKTTVHGVRVGSHIAPSSGPAVRRELAAILKDAQDMITSPWATHCAYETLHPFTDGNGRSGRALWLWHMKRAGQLRKALALGFLHAFYYQTLAAKQDRS
jgi:Fic family protein